MGAWKIHQGQELEGELPAPQDTRWYWKKLNTVKVQFKASYRSAGTWIWAARDNYIVKSGYMWVLGRLVKSPLSKIA